MKRIFERSCRAFISSLFVKNVTIVDRWGNDLRYDKLLVGRVLIVLYLAVRVWLTKHFSVLYSLSDEIVRLFSYCNFSFVHVLVLFKI